MSGFHVEQRKRRPRRRVDVERMLTELGITARRHGGELWAACPNPTHPETRPSWSIINDEDLEAHGTHNCFGCHFSGGPLDLVQAIIGGSMHGARLWVDNRELWLKGTIPLAVKYEVVNRYSSGLKIPKGLIAGKLENWATPVRRYAVKRGLTAAQVERWELCYAIDGSMAGRILFPVKDEATRWVSWHARTYCDQDKRYKNASTDDGFDPGAVFGMRWWPSREARAGSTLVITEGALDALSCERAGAKYIAAIGGSDVHQRQQLKLCQWGRILMATDGDNAGDAMHQKMSKLLGARVNVRRVAMLPGRDATDLAVKNIEILRAILCRAVNEVRGRRRLVRSRGSSR